MQRDIGDLHGYQNTAINFLLERPRAMIWLFMGAGKTSITLHALRYLFDSLQVFNVLIIAPKRVCETVWRQEAQQWRYTDGLSFSYLGGGPKKRVKALLTPAMVYLIGYENLPWLEGEIQARWIGRGRPSPFDTVVLDEVTRLKNTRVTQGKKRGRSYLQLAPYARRTIGLTGTPAPNGLIDIFGQYLCLDGGARLGRAFSTFQSRFFYPVDYNRRKWKAFRHTEAELMPLIADITLSMSADDYLKLPPVIFNDLWVELPPTARAAYNKMERDFFLEFDSGKRLDISDQAGLSNRCLQVANGACYLEPGRPEWESIHEEKMGVLDEILEEAAGNPVLLAYQFRHDAEKIIKRYPSAVWLNSEVKEKQMVEIQRRWNDKEIPLVIGHPASIGHGLNLQHGSNTLVWYGGTWSNDLASQTLARLQRQGQKSTVIVHRILARGTLDIVQKAAVEEKQCTEQSLRTAVSQYRAQKKSP